MARNKLKKYAELKTFSNVIDSPDKIGGMIRDKFFGNNHPLVLELGCGTARLLLNLAGLNQKKNFIGIDYMRSRMWHGARDALSAGLRNVLFIHAQIEKISEYFGEGEISEIWLPFPDPYPKPSKSNKRLSSPNFLSLYRKVAEQNAKVHLKTDNIELLNFTMDYINKSGIKIHSYIENIHTQNNLPYGVKIVTDYERRHIAAGKKIHYLCFNLFPSR